MANYRKNQPENDTVSSETVKQNIDNQNNLERLESALIEAKEYQEFEADQITQFVQDVQDRVFFFNRLGRNLEAMKVTNTPNIRFHDPETSKSFFRSLKSKLYGNSTPSSQHQISAGVSDPDTI